MIGPRLEKFGKHLSIVRPLAYIKKTKKVSFSSSYQISNVNPILVNTALNGTVDRNLTPVADCIHVGTATHQPPVSLNLYKILS